MYGYIVPEKNTLRASDFVLYRSFYCGMCCETGRTYGQFPRFTTNYDFAFLAALVHDYASADIVIEEHKCILNPIKKKAVLQHNPLLEKLAAANIILAYKKADDGVRDGDGIKYRAVRSALKRPFKKAKRVFPECLDAIERFDKAMSAVEQSNVAGIDRAADPFASLMRDMPSLLLGTDTSADMKGLCYNVGKFAYLADALDDIGDDFKAKRYNPFLAAYGDYKDRKSFLSAHADDLKFAFGAICGSAERHFSALKFTQSYSLLKNIVFDGMRSKTDELLSSEKKLKAPRI